MGIRVPSPAHQILRLVATTVLGYDSVNLVLFVGSTLLWCRCGSWSWFQLADVEHGVELAHPIWKVGQLIGVASPASTNLEGANPARG